MSENTEDVAHLPRLPYGTFGPTAPALPSLDAVDEGDPADDDNADERLPALAQAALSASNAAGPQAFFRQSRLEAASAGGKAEGLPVRWHNLSVIGSGSPEAIAPSLGSTVIDAAGPAVYRTVRHALEKAVGWKAPEPRQRLIINSSGLLEQARALDER
jgi:hypothetical protein